MARPAPSTTRSAAGRCRSPRASRSWSPSSTSRHGSCPEAFGRTVVNRFGQRLRAQLLREAAAVVVGSEATARAARRVLRIRRDRFTSCRSRRAPGSRRPPMRRSEARGRRRGRPPRATRARRSLPRLHRPVRRAAGPRDAARRPSPRSPCAGRPAGLAPDMPWPPRILRRRCQPGRPGIGGPRRRAQGDRRVARVRPGAADRRPGRAGPRGPRAPSCRSSPRRPACRPSRRSPAASRSWRPRSGHSPSWSVRPASWSSRATRTAWRSRSPTIWADDGVHDGIAALALEGARREPRTWADVARETRAIYAAVGRRQDAGRSMSSSGSVTASPAACPSPD